MRVANDFEKNFSVVKLNILSATAVSKVAAV